MKSGYASSPESFIDDDRNPLSAAKEKAVESDARNSSLLDSDVNNQSVKSLLIFLFAIFVDLEH